MQHHRYCTSAGNEDRPERERDGDSTHRSCTLDRTEAICLLTGGGTDRGWASALSSYDIRMSVEFTAVFRQVPEGYIGFVEELPGANTQGSTLEEARCNLREAVELVLEANRELIVEATRGQSVIRERLKVTA